MNLTIRRLKSEEITDVASFIATGYQDDVFFKWCVNHDENQHRIVTEYYKVYLNAEGCISHVAETTDGQLVGATVWLPHDVDASIYDDINEVVAAHADHFQEVADKSHANEPTEVPFYQLVAVVTDKALRDQGIGAALLKHQLDQLDERGIPTYLEASTPYVQGKGVYGKFDYKPYGQIMTFSKEALLYPLYRPAGGVR